MTSLLFWEILSFCLALSRLVRRDGVGVRGNISFGFTSFYGRSVIFWHRNDWMSKYLYKAQTDLFKFTLNLNCNNELFKMFFFSHNNNTPITDYSSVLRKTELYKQFFKRGNSRSPLARHTKKGKCQIFAGVPQNTSFHSNQMLLSFSFASIVNNTPGNSRFVALIQFSEKKEEQKKIS